MYGIVYFTFFSCRPARRSLHHLSLTTPSTPTCLAKLSGRARSLSLSYRTRGALMDFIPVFVFDPYVGDERPTVSTLYTPSPGYLVAGTLISSIPTLLV